MPLLHDSTFDIWKVVSNWYQLVPPLPSPVKPVTADRGDARVVVLDVAVEAGDAEVGTRRRHDPRCVRLFSESKSIR